MLIKRSKFGSAQMIHQTVAKAMRRLKGAAG